MAVLSVSTAGLPPVATGLLQEVLVGQEGTLGLLADWLQDNPEYAGPVLGAVARLSEWCNYDPAPDDDRFSATEYVVDGTSCERLDLWRRWHDEMDWQQDSHGVCLILGRVGTRPVLVNFTWGIINDYRVLWCEPVGEVHDQAMLDRWLFKHCHPTLVGGGPARCDAMNFHLCVERIRGAQREVWR